MFFPLATIPFFLFLNKDVYLFTIENKSTAEKLNKCLSVALGDGAALLLVCLAFNI